MLGSSQGSIGEGRNNLVTKQRRGYKKTGCKIREAVL